MHLACDYLFIGISVVFCQLRCIKERIDFAIIGNQSEIDFFLVLVMRTTTLVFNAVFLFLRISRIFAIAPLSSLLIFSVIDFPFFYSFSGRSDWKIQNRKKQKPMHKIRACECLRVCALITWQKFGNFEIVLNIVPCVVTN